MSTSRPHFSDARISYLDKNSQAEGLGPVVVGKNMSHEQYLEVAALEQVQHVIDLQHDCYPTLVSQSLELLTSPEAFFQNPMDTLLGHQKENYSTKTWKFNSSQQKLGILEEIKLFLQNKKTPSIVTDNIILSCDEIYTNSVFNAPFAGENSTKCRQEHHELDPGIFNEIAIGIADDSIGIYCTDQFGSLHAKKFIQHILDCQKNGLSDSMREQIDQGAGIGSFLIFTLCMNLYLGVKRECQTIVGLTFNTSRKRGLTNNSVKSIHLLSLNN